MLSHKIFMKIWNCNFLQVLLDPAQQLKKKRKINFGLSFTSNFLHSRVQYKPLLRLFSRCHFIRYLRGGGFIVTGVTYSQLPVSGDLTSIKPSSGYYHQHSLCTPLVYITYTTVSCRTRVPCKLHHFERVSHVMSVWHL